MGGFYMQYLESLCRRRGWPDPTYESHTDADGYTCLVLVNGREYQTEMSYESADIAHENAAMRAFRICRNFSANDRRTEPLDKEDPRAQAYRRANTFNNLDNIRSLASGSSSKDKTKLEKDKKNSAGPRLFNRFKSSIGMADEKDRPRKSEDSKRSMDEPERPRKSEDGKKNSFLDDDGTLGAGAGLAGAAASHMFGQNATDVFFNPPSRTPYPPSWSHGSRSLKPLSLVTKTSKEPLRPLTAPNGRLSPTDGYEPMNTGGQGFDPVRESQRRQANMAGFPLMLDPASEPKRAPDGFPFTSFLAEHMDALGFRPADIPLPAAKYGELDLAPQYVPLPAATDKELDTGSRDSDIDEGLISSISVKPIRRSPQDSKRPRPGSGYSLGRSAPFKPVNKEKMPEKKANYEDTMQDGSVIRGTVTRDEEPSYTTPEHYENRATEASCSPSTESGVENEHLTRADAKTPSDLGNDLEQDLILGEVFPGVQCWTCTPSSTALTEEVPLSLDGAPVVVPVEGQYPLGASLIPPPDPHPKFIDPSFRLHSDTISEILTVYDMSVGFYLLVNGWLQIIVPPEFPYEHALSHLPRFFGGLRVSYVSESTLLCMKREGDIAQVQQATASSSRTTGLDLFSQQLSLSNTGETQGQPGTSSMGLEITLGSTIHASVRGAKLKERFEATIGLMTRSLGQTYLTIPTHLVSSVLQASRQERLSLSEGMTYVQIHASNNRSKELGPVTKTFDPEAGTFPVGYHHDVSLVDVSNAPQHVVSGIKAPIATEWLSQGDRQRLKYHTSNLHLLPRVRDSSVTERCAKSMPLPDSQCQAVGQGIFNRQRLPRLWDRFMSRQADLLPDAQTWTRLVSRSLLFRVHPDIFPQGIPSGTAVCTLEEGEDGSRCAKVAGFTSFAQEVTVIQNFELEGPRLYSRLEHGRVAFFGAFEVPDELRDTHVIVQ